MVSFTAAILLAAGALATPLEHEARQASCPPIHVFGARETTAPAGMGTAGPIVQAIVQAHPGATSEAIDYPACGGQGQCGGIQYGDSVKAGTAAVAKAVNAFNEKCPETQIVLIGYSQVSRPIWAAIQNKMPNIFSCLANAITYVGRSNLRQRLLWWR